MVLPVVAVVALIITVLTGHPGDFGGGRLTCLIVAFAFVGYSEELMTRGVLLTVSGPGSERCGRGSPAPSSSA